MCVTAVVIARNSCQGAQLRRGQQAVGYGNAQHWRVALDIQPVAQPQMAKFVFAQLSGQEPLRLVAKLRYALLDEGLVGEVVPIHGKERYVA